MMLVQGDAGNPGCTSVWALLHPPRCPGDAPQAVEAGAASVAMATPKKRSQQFVFFLLKAKQLA